jgi:hypothetical protein
MREREKLSGADRLQFSSVFRPAKTVVSLVCNSPFLRLVLLRRVVRSGGEALGLDPVEQCTGKRPEQV